MLNLRFGFGLMALDIMTACAANDEGSVLLSFTSSSGGSTAGTSMSNAPPSTGSRAEGGSTKAEQGGTYSVSADATELGGTSTTTKDMTVDQSLGGGTSTRSSQGGNSTKLGSGGMSNTGTLSKVNNACAQVSGESKSFSAPPVIEFVVDNSDSMSDDSQPSTRGKTKWQALQDAFNKAIPILANLHPEYAVGLTYLHYRDSGALAQCTDAVQAVEIAPLTSRQADALVKSVQTEGCFGMTPTHDIWQFAADYALSWSGGSTYAASNRYVVVLTDGVPTIAVNCGAAGGCRSTLDGWGSYNSNLGMGVTSSQYQDFANAVARYQTGKNTSTFMVAIPGAEALNQVTCSDGSVLYEPIAKMGEVARAGGTDLIDLTTSATTDFTAGLVDAITQRIGGQVVTVLSCAYAVPAPPTDAAGNQQYIDPKQVGVWYYENGGTDCVADRDCGSGHCSPSTSANPNKCYTLVDRSEGCVDPTGWDYADPENKTISLCSSSCAEAQADAGAKIEIMIGCFEVG